MTILSKNIRYLRKKNEWSQNHIAEKLGYKSYTTIQKWETGTSEPPLNKTRKLAELFKVDIDDLTNKDLEFSNDMRGSQPKCVTINVLRRVSAGISIESTENVIDTEEIAVEDARTGKFFGLRIQGDSMEPNIHNGDTVIVRQQDDAENDEIVIALVNGNDGVCKRLKKYDSSIALVSSNANYEPMYFSQKEMGDKPIQIIGKVVELRRKL
ncbi:MAG: helix-turn-helix domain-containing protein [Clostridiales bacterium]|nr:helix-turn-helix domain-containing protein [Clostridiales bacterium]